jgi:hypothetical protein
MTPELKKDEEFSVKGFLHWPIIEIQEDNNRLRMKSGTDFYVRTALNEEGKGYFYISSESGYGEPRIEQLDKLMKTVPLILSDPSAGGLYNSNSRQYFENFICDLIYDNNGRLNGGIWPCVSERLLICTNKVPFELLFHPQPNGKGYRPSLIESYDFLEAICPRKEQISKTKLGLNLPKGLKEVYLEESPERVEPFGHWYGRAFPLYKTVIDSYGWRR